MFNQFRRDARTGAGRPLTNCREAIRYFELIKESICNIEHAINRADLMRSTRASDEEFSMKN